MRKKTMTFLAILTVIPFILAANFLLPMPGAGNDINGVYKNDKFVLKVENFNQQSSTFSFTLNSPKGSACTLSLQGTATRLPLSYASPDKVRYEYKDASGCRYFFTVYSGKDASVEIMRYDEANKTSNSCLQNSVSSKLTFERKK
jgi:hypothetical protein